MMKYWNSDILTYTEERIEDTEVENDSQYFDHSPEELAEI